MIDSRIFMEMDWLRARAGATPEKLALIIGAQRWSYGELETAVARTAAFLRQQGMREGDFVAVLLPNSFHYVCLIHALARLGAVLVPLNARLTKAEIAWQIEHVGARWLAAGENPEKWLAANCHWIRTGSDWFETEPAVDDHLPFSLGRLQAIIFTSGTSGRPKGAMLTLGNHYYSAAGSAVRLGVLPDDLWLSVLPLYHVGGLAVIFRSCLYGTAVDLHPHFNLDTVNDALDHKPITLISLVPTMLHRLLAVRSHWPASLRLILLGGAAATPELVQQANALPRKVISHQLSVISERSVHNSQFTIHHSPLVAPTYGLTEAASQVATMLPADAARKPGSVGKPLPFTSVKIVDENGDERPSGEYGEIVVTGLTVMAGYFSSERPVASGKSNAPVARDPQPATIATGDIGYLDADGDLWLVQRRSDLIVSGGENVYPAEVEAALRRHPAVVEACVVGVPDAEWGQRVAAMVQVREGTAVSPDELITFCREHLAGYKIPRRVQLVDALPLTASGKIGRRQVAETLSKRSSL